MPKTRQKIFERDSRGTFKKSCGALTHNDSEPTSSKLYNIEKGKKLKRSTLDFLFEKHIISKRTKYICHSCVLKAEQNTSTKSYVVSQPEENTISATKYDEDISDYKSCIDTAKSLRDLIQSDISQLYNNRDKCSLANLLGYDPEKWLRERPKALVGLLRELCGFDRNITNENQFKLAKIVELIYGCRNSKLVLPLSFQENLLIYSISRNKQLLTHNSRVSPAGSSDTISKWLADEASTPVEFPKGLVRTVFDNEQVIGKTYRIKADSKVPTSIVTSHLYICIDPESTIQNDEKFAPSNWLFDKPNDHQKALFLSEDENCVNVFRVTRNNLISRCLVSVELEHSNGSFDFIDSVLSRKACREKVCLHCGAENEFTGRKCTNCKGPLVHECQNFSDIYDKKNNLNPYSFFSSIETETHNFSVKTGEPDLCNPGSFENVAEILTNVSERAGITNDRESGRKWLFLECDGGIYSIVDKLIFNVYHCTQCDEGFYGYDNFLEHRCSILHNIQPQHQYGWLVPLPGLLHIEMNACKAFFEITWDVVLKDFCMKLGYNSPKALDYAKSCGDHHKSWKILEIFYLAAADELLVPYVRECKISNIEPSVEGYWLWASDIEDPNYMFIQQMVFTYLHSMILFRVGCRRGNADAIVAGREKMSHLFFARNHPRYQRIISQSRYIEVMMPDELKDIVKSSLTLSRTGNTGHYQGGDACLEEINKEAKCWISPKGIPSDKEWLRVFRNLDNLMTVKKKILDTSSGVANSKYNQEQKVENNEIVPIREMLRSRKYLLNPKQKNQPHTSLNGNIKLCDDLKNFTAQSEAIKDMYLQEFISQEESVYKKEIIYITEEEKNEKQAIHNQSKAEIHKKILQMLDLKPLKEAKIMEELFTKTVKGKCKEEYLNFYYMLIDDIE